MRTYIKYFSLLFSFVFISASMGYGQQPTREQLLKLFYKAHTAQKENNQQTAISTYKEILKLSPGLPDPYLQLGNLYATMEEDADALKKACICYSTYLDLKPEATNASVLKSKVEALTLKVAELEKAASAVEVLQAEVLPEVEKAPAQKESVVVAVVPKEEKIDSVLQVAVDTVPPTAPVLLASPVDEGLLGRWASAEMGDDGCEMWIMDVMKRQDNEMWMRFNPHSYAKNNPLLAAMYDWEAPAYIDGDSLVFTFKIEKKKEKKEKKRGLLGEFGTVVSEMFDVNWKNLTGKGEAQATDTVKALPKADSLSVDTVPDSLRILREPLMLYTYEFRLKRTEGKLCGTLRNKVVERSFHEKVLTDEKKVCEFFATPTEYTGFTYTPVTDELKVTRKEFRELLNQKIQESAGSTSALNDLGCMYASGIGTRKNMKMAVAYLMEAAMKNNLFGMLNMAQLYREGLGVEKDVEKARELYHRAYESGYTDAMVLCGDTYLEGSVDTEPDYKNALVCYQKAVFRRCPYASYRLGWLYHEGLGVEQDSAKAWNYYQQAFAMQYPDAMTDVGVFYRDGVMVAKDYAKALECLNKAVAKGNARAMYELSQMYLRGQGVEADFKRSKEWLYKSMEADDRIIEGFNTVKSKINAVLHPKQ